MLIRKGGTPTITMELARSFSNRVSRHMASKRRSHSSNSARSFRSFIVCFVFLTFEWSRILIPLARVWEKASSSFSFKRILQDRDSKVCHGPSFARRCVGGALHCQDVET